jgi:hypothetical protein
MSVEDLRIGRSIRFSIVRTVPGVVKRWQASLIRTHVLASKMSIIRRNPDSRAPMKSENKPHTTKNAALIRFSSHSRGSCAYSRDRASHIGIGNIGLKLVLAFGVVGLY